MRSPHFNRSQRHVAARVLGLNNNRVGPSLRPRETLRPKINVQWPGNFPVGPQAALWFITPYLSDPNSGRRIMIINCICNEPRRNHAMVRRPKFFWVGHYAGKHWRVCIRANTRNGESKFCYAAPREFSPLCSLKKHQVRMPRVSVRPHPQVIIGGIIHNRDEISEERRVGEAWRWRGAWQW